MLPRERYFVRRLDARSYRPSPDAEYEIQILESDGSVERCAYIERESASVIAVVHSTVTGPISLPVKGHGIPDAVIKAALERSIGFGEYVNEKGEIVPPSFLPPWA